MFLAQRPQQPLFLSPNLDLSWQGITRPARPASRTSDSVIPLHKHTYMAPSTNDYEKHYHDAIVQGFCQALFPQPGARLFVCPLEGKRLREGGFQLLNHFADRVEP